MPHQCSRHLRSRFRGEDDRIRERIVEASVAAYLAGIVVPVLIITMRNGASCGARSAYSKPGGASPLCYPSDVTGPMGNR
jgi:hypothetical protein